MDKELFAALSCPNFYGEATSRVEVAQTHISFLFFTDNHVYKVKKAVNFGFLDFSTLELRRHYCNREVDLNSRLCPDLYLGVAEIKRWGDKFALGGAGEIVEYAVKMRRLPRDRMMDVMLSGGIVPLQVAVDLAKKIYNFHSKCSRDEQISSYGELKMIRENIEENFLQTVRFIGQSLSAPRYAFIEEAAQNFMIENRDLFSRRIKEGRIRDCHGDLRLEHICLADDIYIFDCIEFNDRFRYGDVASDIAFLAMDLDRSGALGLSRDFVKSYAEISGDADLRRLINFYKCYRAYVRGKVESFKIDDACIGPDEQKRSIVEARNFFDLSFSCALAMQKPVMIITCGRMGTGKTSIAEALGRRLKINLISTDILRKETLGIAQGQPIVEDYGKGFYKEAERYKIYDRVLDLAAAQIAEGDSIILDGSFSKQQMREAALDVAKRFGADFLLLHFVCSDETALGRLRRRRGAGYLLSDGRPEIYYQQKADFEEPNEVDPQKRVAIDSQAEIDKCVEGALDALASKF